VTLIAAGHKPGPTYGTPQGTGIVMILGADFSPASGRAERRAPTPRYVVRMWEELLRVEDISVHDDFFGLGGHSLLAARGRMRIRRDLRADLPPEVVFENSVVEDLASVIDAAMQPVDGRTPANVDASSA